MIVELAEQRELRRICNAVLDARKHIDRTHMRRARGVIDPAECEAEIAAALEQLAQLKSDLVAAMLRWPSTAETQNANQQ